MNSNDVLLRQYKKLSREWHPDKNSSQEAEEIMKNITMAYRILGDRVEQIYEQKNNHGQKA